MEIAHDKGRLVLLLNLDPQYTSGEVEVWLPHFLLNWLLLLSSDWFHIAMYFYVCRVRVKISFMLFTCVFSFLSVTVLCSAQCLDVLTLSYFQDIIWHTFRERCTARVVPHTAISNPSSGMYCFLIHSEWFISCTNNFKRGVYGSLVPVSLSCNSIFYIFTSFPCLIQFANKAQSMTLFPLLFKIALFQVKLLLYLNQVMLQTKLYINWMRNA